MGLSDAAQAGVQSHPRSAKLQVGRRPMTNCSQYQRFGKAWRTGGEPAARRPPSRTIQAIGPWLKRSWVKDR